jgi:hypothetical protein
MSLKLKILCSGYLLRYPLGGLTWHHLQYLLGFARLGHEVTYFENYGWENSCYDTERNEMTDDPTYGVKYLTEIFAKYGLENSWCYLAEGGTAYGISREELTQRCRESDVYFNLSNINWIDELEHCRRRVLIDTDPVFTQIGGHGIGGAFENYHALFTYAENVHCSEMPTAGVNWMPTRQPIFLDAWAVKISHPAAPITTVMNWSAYGEREYEGKMYGQKDREFLPYFDLPNVAQTPMEIALNAPAEIREKVKTGGWRLADPSVVTRTPQTYQKYLQNSKAEFSVAKHAYVCTRNGWFSDRSAGYLASGRPVIVQDTGFSDFLPCGKGLLSFQTRDEALAAIENLQQDYDAHCQAARKLAEDFFDAEKVLQDLLTRSL